MSTMQAFITWSAEPEIFRLGSLAIRWYGLLFALSFVFGYIIMLRFFRKEGVPDKVLDVLTTFMVIGTVVGARLGHCFFYEPDYYLANPVKILYVWEGGLASHGAGIGIILALWLFSRSQKRPFIWIIDRIVIVVALAGFFIRMGNLFNSEIYGTVTSLPWGFVFERASDASEAADPRHPTQIYEGLSYLLIFCYLIWFYYRKNGKPAAGYLFGMFLILVFGMRFLIEFLKVPQVGFEQSMTLNMGQLLSIPFVLAGLFFVFFYHKGTKTP